MLVDGTKLLEEYAGVRFGDARLDSRLRQMLPQLAAAPSDSFPEQMQSEAAQEAVYRFFANEKVTIEALLQGHRDKTLNRVAAHQLVRIAHDTTEFVFEGDREGLHVRKGAENGSFYGHFALVTVADESREPLGILGVRPFVDTTYERRELTKSEQATRCRATPREEKNSSRWENLALDISRELPEGVEAIHLMDQEADDYNVFSALQDAGVRFVIRVASHRLTADNIRTSEVLAVKTAQFFRNVQVSPRSRKKAKRQHPERVERTAELSVRASTITLKRPRSSPDAQLETLSLSAVHVFEASPPPGEPPIEWMLFTSEPIGTLEEIEAIVDHYRGRWVIEEYFKALKTGCAFEKRQLCSFDALVRALGLFVPIAWTLLALRILGREKTQRSATHVFNAEQLRLLRALLTKRRRTLPNEPTVRDAMLGIAALGGHIKNNGDPGWLVLGRGLRRFSEAEEVWNLIREEM